MHLYVNLKPDYELTIPLTYNYLVQSMIYHNIDSDLAAFLHEKGFESGSRRFKLFSFSRLSGKFNIDTPRGMISFQGDVRLVISSSLNRFCQSIANGLLNKEYIIIGKNRVKADRIEIQQYIASEEKLTIKTLSPVVAYSTFLRPDNRKYTCYFQPGEPDYDNLISSNLCKKYQALYGRELEGKVKVKALGPVKLHVINYKEGVIKGYSGKFQLTGPRELLQTALDTGLGSKNSQGFGCVTPV